MLNNGFHSPYVLLTGRVPALPARVARELYAAGDPVQTTRTLFARWPMFDAALALASPSLHAATVAWQKGESTKNKRLPYKVLAYALRMATRATPFGLFAGVGTIACGSTTSLRLGPRSKSRVVCRADMAWLYGLHQALESDTSVRGRLPVVANDLVLLRGNRLFVLHADRLARGHADGDGLAWYYEPFSLRWTPTLERARMACTSEASLDTIVARLASQLSLATSVASILADRLLESGVLVFSRPAPIDDALAELTTTLNGDDTGRFQALKAVQHKLATVSAATIDSATLGELTAGLQTEFQSSRSPLCIDLIETFEGELGATIVADVMVLGRIMLSSAAPRSLDRYRERFMKRYEGAERRVPLLELVDPDAGIGVPDDTSLQPPDRDRMRDEIRLTLASRALRDGSQEVVLSSAEVDELHPGHATLPLPLNGFEIGFQVAALDVTALQTQAYLIRPVVGLNTDGAYKTIGRFAGAFGDSFAARLQALEPLPGSDDSLPTELVYVPQDRHYANLLRTALPSHVIASCSERLHPGTPRIEPQDIVIGLEDGKFVASSLSLQRRLSISESYMLSTPYFAPSHIRLLSLIGKQDNVLPRLFEWGPAASMPRLPRVRYGRLVLTVARWAIPRRSLVKNSKQLQAFFSDWRAEWNMPRWVYLVERDLKLLLDLDSPHSIELVRDEINSPQDNYPHDPLLHFEEMFPSFDDVWLERDGERYFHEFVAGVPGRTALTKSAPADFTVDRAILRGPGSERVFVKIYCGAGDVEALLRGPVSNIVTDCAERTGVSRWFYVRYADPETHIRLRLQTTSGSGIETIAAVCAELEPLLARGGLRRYTFDTYRQELERYGGPAAIEHVETLFGCDSRRVMAALRTAPPSWSARLQSALATLATFTCTWFAAFNVRDWLAANEVSARAVRDVDWSAVRTFRQEVLVASDAGDDECDAIAALAGLEHTGTLAPPSAALLNSLLHMHFNRIGVPLSDERSVFAIVWHAWHGLEREGRLPSEVRRN